jgi:alpha-amylase/alpha-mannosidase (GH57 family)
VRHDGTSLAVFFRDDVLSNRIAFEQLEAKDFIAHLEQWRGERENIYVITAMDAETFGHHIKGWERMFLAEVYDELKPPLETRGNIERAGVSASHQMAVVGGSEAAKQIRMVTISELLELFPRSSTIEPVPSSWSTTAEDIASGNPYPLWNGRNNEVHHLQWEHLAVCVELVNKALKCADNEESRRLATAARQLLDKAEHSDQMWWASKRPSWDIDLINMGMLLQVRVAVNAYRAINKSGADEKTKQECHERILAARDIRSKLEDQLFL